MQAPAVNTIACLSATLCQIFFTTQWSGHCPQWCNLLVLVEICSYFFVILKIHSNNQSQICFCFFYSLTKGGGGVRRMHTAWSSRVWIVWTDLLYFCIAVHLRSMETTIFLPTETFYSYIHSSTRQLTPLHTPAENQRRQRALYMAVRTWSCLHKFWARSWRFRNINFSVPTHSPADEKAGSLKMNTALEYSTRVVQEGSGVLIVKSTLFTSKTPLLDHSCTVLKSSIHL
jgi:hypothetical protein